MAERVVLHVGAMKSGTSYLQRLLSANRDVLAERGVLFPGRTWRAQVRGVADILERKRVIGGSPQGAWQALVAELEAWPGTGVVSMEFLGQAGRAGIGRVVPSFPAGSVEVVVTARDLGRNVPAMWQEALKNGRTWTFTDYVEAIRTDDGPGARFWREQDVAAMCRRWSEAVGADAVTVVTVPPPGAPPEELWSRFCAAIGADAGGVRVPGAANESLGVASAEVLRRLNVRLDGMPYGDYAPLVKHQLAKQVLAGRRADEPAVGFDPPDWLRDRATRIAERIGALGVRVVGDLADLEPRPAPGRGPDSLSPEDQLEAAVAALEGLVRLRSTAAGETGSEPDSN